ncbi:MAG: hypothetical protein J7603_04350 [Pseudacidovorax sp.]|nr:hypothetical protein [Pseudacidovorax sp.]
MTFALRSSPRALQKRKSEQQPVYNAQLRSHHEEKLLHRRPKSAPSAYDPQVQVERDSGFVRVTILLPEGNQPAGRIAASKTRLPGSLTLKKSVSRVVKFLYGDAPTLNLVQMAERLEAAALHVSPPAVRTKSTQATIGVTSSTELKERIARDANTLQVAASEVARTAFEKGFTAFEERLWDEASATVSKDFEDAYGKYVGVETAQWSLRLSRHMHVRAVVLARERGISMSSLACWCLAKGLD